MTERFSGTTVLIVEKDLGFVLWLADIFREAGCDVVPALDCTEAVSAARNLDLEVDLVIVNFGLRDVVEMIKTLRDLGGPFKIVALTVEGEDTARTIPVDGIFKRAFRAGPMRQEWQERARHILRDLQVNGRNTT